MGKTDARLGKEIVLKKGVKLDKKGTRLDKKKVRNWSINLYLKKGVKLGKKGAKFEGSRQFGQLFISIRKIIKIYLKNVTENPKKASKIENICKIE